MTTQFQRSLHCLIAVLAMAKSVCRRYPESPRAQHLQAYVAVQLMTKPAWNQQKRMRILEEAMNHTGKVSVTFRRSLPISLLLTKLLIVLGKYDAAEEECLRALQIEGPDDPHADDLPVRSTAGDKVSERISYLKIQLTQLQDTMVFAAQHQLTFLRKDFTDTLLSVDIQNLLNYYKYRDCTLYHTLSTAVECYRTHGSWTIWVCPYCSGDLGEASVESTDAESFLTHIILRHHAMISDKTLDENPSSPSTLLAINKLLDVDTKTSTSHEALDVMSFCEEENQLCFKDIKKLFNYLAPVSSCEKVERRHGGPCFELLLQKLVSTINKSDPEVDDNDDSLRILWTKVKEVCLLDYGEAILPLLASYKWAEVKACLKNGKKLSDWRYYGDILDALFFHPPGILNGNFDPALESVKEQEPGIVPSEDAPSVTNNITMEHTKGKVSHYAWMYGKPGKVPSAQVSRFLQLTEDGLAYHPYKDKLVHEAYSRELARKLSLKPPLHACSYCFFELNTPVGIIQVILNCWHRM
ncbi:hypothetical protein BS78_01G502100 [Paspalum vaginatum]|nr:hypothetical protein BS78_01G502100 [Paspalum vaginatum]